MFDMTKTNKKTGEEKIVKVPHSFAEAVLYGGALAVTGVLMGFLDGAVKDIKHVLKKKK